MCATYMKTQEEEEVESDSRREDELSTDEPYELKEKLDDMASTLSEGPQEGPTTTQTECHWVQLTTTYQWNKDERPHRKKKKKKKNLYYFSNINT